MGKKKPGTRTLRIEVVHALHEKQTQLTLNVEEGTTALVAIERSEILRYYPEIDLERVGLGVFGREVSPATPLRDGDRVEIYRPLIVNPKGARRERAQQGRRRWRAK